MSNLTHRLFTVASLALLAASALAAQAPAPSSSSTGPVSSSVIEQNIDLAAKGQCPEAIPALKKNLPRISNRDLKYRAAMALAKCAMSLEQGETATQALFLLNHDFPDDPEVLYITTHYFSELANRAARHLASSVPASYQAHELQAEAMESQGKWDEAAGEYNAILEQNPKQPGIHFRLGRLALSKSDTLAGAEQAKKEFELELQIDPANAASEFWLGEIARRSGLWDEAVPHFTKASQLDPAFAEAYLALGMTLSAAQKFSDAVEPLQHYVKLVPDDPAGHYQLAIAYARTDRKDDATREMATQRQLTEKNAAAKSSPNGAAPQP
jgi:tetratricopeptide (TPR) repeat protein